MHSAANSRKSVDGLRPSKLLPLSSFGIFFGIGNYENSLRNYCELICRGLMIQANRLLIRANKHAIHLASSQDCNFVLKHLQPTEQSQSGLRTHRRSCCFARLVDVRHATSSTFKDMKVGQVPKSRRCASEPHNLSAAWANRRPWRIFTRVFVAHGRKRPLNRNVVQADQRPR